MLPDGWKNTTLGAVCQIATGGTPNRAVPEYWSGDIPWMSSGEINQRIVRSVAEHITALGMANSNARPLPPGTVMMALNGQGKTRGKVALLEIETTCNQSLAGLIADRTRLLPDYLFYSLDAQYQDIRNITGDDARNGLNLGILRALAIPLPPIVEQRRIAEVLRSADEAIAASQATLQQSEVALSALSNELFAAAMSSGDGEWPQHPLEGMLDNIIDYRGVPPPKADSGIPLLTAKNVRFGYLDFEPREYIAVKDYDSWMRRGLPTAGDIMFTTEAPLGNVAEYPDIKAALGQRTLTLVPKPGALDAKFLKWLLLSKPAQDLIWSHATGSTAKGIKQRTFRKLKFGFPALDEQVRIARLLEDIGSARDAAKRSGEAYAVVKAHLMADLLSGQVRVPA